MIDVAIVEDEEFHRKLLEEFLLRYEKENHISFKIQTFLNGNQFLSARASFDIIFMDIRMPYLNGMETAKKLREMDEQCALIFVTNMAKYAIAGYEVNALYFMVKPIVYEDFCFKMKKVVAYVQRRRETTVFVKTAEGIVKLDVDDIYFIEVLSHRLSYHTVQGIFQTWDTLSHVEESLSGQSFARCNVSYLVNLRHVTEVSNNYVLVGGEQLKISAPKKKSFLDALTKSISGGT